jgi:hypothetical protein
MRAATAGAMVLGQATDTRSPAMHVKKTLALAITALAFSGGSVAMADTIQLSDDRRGDAHCDGASCPDLKSAIANPGIFNPNELFYIITQHTAIQRSSVPRIAINTRGTNGSKPEYYVEKQGARAGVFSAKTGRRTGPAALRSSHRTSLSWTFLPSAIGNPKSFGWRVEVVRGGARIDAAPNSGYVTRRP